MNRRLIKITFPIIFLVGVYFLGPAPEKPMYNLSMPVVPSNAGDLEKYIASNEAKHRLKPDNEARVVWLDSTKQKTEFAIVYLHGFSASQMEGDPIHQKLAKEYGCNLYLSRLADHGVDTTEALQLFTADRAWNSAKEALAIGKQIGNKVILMSTSTGGTLALKLAAEYPDDVYALVNMSPNIAINNPAAFLLNNPYGIYIARAVMGGKYRGADEISEKSKYWNSKYRLEGAVELQELLETSMNDKTFSRIHQPSLTLYYFKDEEHQDPEVKVSAMLEMHKALGTSDSLKVEHAIPNAEAHVIGGSLVSKDVETVYHAIQDFFDHQLHMRRTPIASM